MLIAIVEVAAFDYRNSHCLEVSDAGCEEVGRRMILWRHRPAFDLKRDTETITTQRQRQNRTRRLNAGRRFESLLQVDEKLTLIAALVFDLRQSHVECENVLRMETAVNISQTPETLNQQCRAC